MNEPRAREDAMRDSLRQQAHYERRISTYERHHFDRWSTRYRERFIYRPMWGDIDFNGKEVAELACGSGQNTAAFLRSFPAASVTGYDISPTACEKFRALTGCPAHVVDLTQPVDGSNAYDAAFVIGGLHHCIVDLPQTIRNIAGMIRPGGHLMMLEPNARHLLEGLRRRWYRVDPNFDAATEGALDHDALLASTDDFVLSDVRYLGGPAYFFVLNSVITRVPLWLKPAISPPLLALERLWNASGWPRMNNVFLARWRRT